MPNYLLLAILIFLDYIKKKSNIKELTVRSIAIYKNILTVIGYEINK